MNPLFCCRFLPHGDAPASGPVVQTVRASDAGFAYALFLGWLNSAGMLYRGVIDVRKLLDDGNDGVLVLDGASHSFQI